MPLMPVLVFTKHESGYFFAVCLDAARDHFLIPCGYFLGDIGHIYPDLYGLAAVYKFLLVGRQDCLHDLFDVRHCGGAFFLLAYHRHDDRAVSDLHFRLPRRCACSLPGVRAVRRL